MTDPVQPYDPARPVAPAASDSKKFAIMSLVFGLVALVMAWILPIIWILLAIAGVILGFLSRRRENAKGIALAGIVISFVAIAACIVSMVIGAVIGVQMMQQYQ